MRFAKENTVENLRLTNEKRPPFRCLIIRLPRHNSRNDAPKAKNSTPENAPQLINAQWDIGPVELQVQSHHGHASKYGIEQLLLYPFFNHSRIIK